MIKLGPAKPKICPTESDKAYAAGFFDGEGNICIALNKRGGAKRAYLVYNLRLGASQVDGSVLFWFRDRWGGSVRPLKRNAPHRGFGWICFSRGAVIFLADVLPFLKIKRERAVLALRYQRMIKQRGRAGRTSAHMARMAWFKSTMNRLNAKWNSRNVAR